MKVCLLSLELGVDFLGMMFLIIVISAVINALVFKKVMGKY
jgi:hypothetical protein